MVKRVTLVRPAVRTSQHQIGNQMFMNCTACLIEKFELPTIELDVMMNKHLYHRFEWIPDTLINKTTFYQIWPKQKPGVYKLQHMIVKGQDPNILDRYSITALELKWDSVCLL